MADEIITFGAAFDPSGVARGVTIANQKLNELAAAGKRNEQTFAQASASASRFSERQITIFRGLATETKKTSSAFQQLATDVRLAQADFAGGRIGSGDLATALNVAQQSAMSMRTRGIIPAGHDLGAFNQIMRASVPHAHASSMQMAMLRSQLAGVGAVAVGLPGIVGRLGSTLASFAASGGVVFGAAAAFAAIAAALRLIGKEAREAKEKLTDFLDEQKRAAQARIPQSEQLAATGREFGPQIELARAIRTRAETAVATRLRVGFAQAGMQPTEAEIADAQNRDKKVREARTALVDLLKTQASNQGAINKATEEELDQILTATGYEARINDALKQRAEALEALRTMQPEMAGPSVLPGTRGSRIVRAMMATDTLAARAEKGGLASILEPLSNAAQDRVTDVLEAEKRLAAERRKAVLDAAKATQQMWGAIISGASNLIQSLIRGEASAGATIGGIGATIGGAVAVGNPLLGLGIMGASGILGALFGGKKELPVRDDSSLRELARLRQELRTGPDRVIVVLRDEQTGTERILYEMNRRTRRDAQPRLPPGLGR